MFISIQQGREIPTREHRQRRVWRQEGGHVWAGVHQYFATSLSHGLRPAGHERRQDRRDELVRRRGYAHFPAKADDRAA